ncbi:MAG: glutamate mutase L [Anaerolineae bacterium]|nr:glutamate mutase L [Anaerolineae bacterium]
MALLSSLLGETEEASKGPEVAGAILAVDIGSVYTRAVLLDIVDGMYHFVARGEAPTTATPPWNNVLEGVGRAVQEITTATGRQILDKEGELIMPESDAFLGVSCFVATASAGKPVRAVLVGLMPDVSLSSGKRAAESSYLLLADTISLADRRSPEKQIEALLKARPDVILIVGGTDGGAVQSIRKQIDTIALACELMDYDRRPTILYAGNRDLREEIGTRLVDDVGVNFVAADNVRPTLESEQLNSAQTQLAALYHRQKLRSGGFADIGSWSRGGIYPTAHSLSRAVRILSELDNQSILGIDLGSSSTTIAAHLKGTNYLNVMGSLGMGHGAKGLLASKPKIETFTRWLTYEPDSVDDVLDYVWNKWLFPQIVPATQSSLEMEMAMAREIIRNAVLSARASWRGVRPRGPLPAFDTILLTGSTLTRPPHYGWSVLVMLDALLPFGVTRLVADPHGLAAVLGGVAPFSPRAVVQVLDTGAFIDLCTVISVSGRARQGEVVLRGKLKPIGAGQAEVFEVKYGSIVRLPLAYGEQAELSLQARHVDINVGGNRRSLKIKVTGGEVGVVLDARGRPWRFPRDAAQRHSMNQAWQQSLTQEELS